MKHPSSWTEKGKKRLFLALLLAAVGVAPRGCLPLEQEPLDRIQIPPQVALVQFAVKLLQPVLHNPPSCPVLLLHLFSLL